MLTRLIDRRARLVDMIRLIGRNMKKLLLDIVRRMIHHCRCLMQRILQVILDKVEDCIVAVHIDLDIHWLMVKGV